MFGRLVWKSLVGGRGRTILALATVLVPAALVTATANFALDAECKMSTELRRQGPNVILEVKRGIPAMDPAELDRALKRFPSILSKDSVDPARRVEISAGGEPSQVISSAEAATRDSRTLQARTVPVIAAREGALMGKLRGLFQLIAVLVLGSSGLGMAMALTSSVAERSAEIGLFQALGSTRGLVLRLLAAQVAVLLGAGVGFGAAAGLGLSSAMSRSVFGVPTDFRPVAVLVAALACAGMAVIASFVPVRRALRIHPAAVLKGE